jgi:hypothetical protein
MPAEYGISICGSDVVFNFYRNLSVNVLNLPILPNTLLKKSAADHLLCRQMLEGE